MPPLIPRRQVKEFRRAFSSEVDSLAALYRDAAADMMEVLSDAAVLAGQRGRAVALLRQYQAILANLGDEAAAWMEFNIPRAYDTGIEFADVGVRRVRRAGINLRRQGTGIAGRREREVFAQVHREAVAAIVEEALRTSNFALAQIGRRVDDVFRRVSIEEVAKGIVEGKARIDVSQQIKDRLLAEGRPFFTDRLQRRWDLDRYSEMVARTTTREAMTQGTINRLREEGIELAQVSWHPCNDFCVYYEHVIVSIGKTPHPNYPDISAIDGGPPFHPNCLPPGQRVATRRGLVPIQEVRVGDQVLTHRGRYRPVTGVFSRDYEGPVVTLVAGGSPVSATPEHPFLCPWGWVAAGHIRGHVPLAVGHQGQDFGQDLLWTPAEPFCRDANYLPSLLFQESVAGAVPGASLRVPMVLPIEFHVEQDRREGEVQHIPPPGHLKAPPLTQPARNEQIGELLLGGGRTAAAAQRQAPRACDPGVVEVRGVAHLHAQGMEVVEVGGLLGQALSLMAPGADGYAEPAHGFEDGADVTARELAREVANRTSLDLVATAQVTLERFARAPFHSSQRASKLQLASTGEATGATFRRGRRHHGDGSSADHTAHDHSHSPAAPGNGHWAPTSYIREERRICRVYNLEVLEDNSYVVEGLVAHNCLHVLMPFVEPLATDQDKQRGMIAPDLLNRTPAELQQRYRRESGSAAKDADRRRAVVRGEA